MSDQRIPTEAERCARCAEVQQEVMEAAQRANNSADFFRRLKKRAIVAQAELDDLDRKRARAAFPPADRSNGNGAADIPAADVHDAPARDGDGMLTVW